MSDVLKFSDAASLGIHAAVFLARKLNKPQAVGHIASILHCSEAHLSKVMQRLTKSGIASATRGPRGGYILNRDPETITLLEVFEAIEGPLEMSTCLLGTPICQGTDCVLGDLPHRLNTQIHDYLSNAYLNELTQVYDRPGQDTCAHSDKS